MVSRSPWLYSWSLGEAPEAPQEHGSTSLALAGLECPSQPAGRERGWRSEPSTLHTPLPLLPGHRGTQPAQVHRKAERGSGAAAPGFDS